MVFIIALSVNVAPSASQVTLGEIQAGVELTRDQDASTRNVADFAQFEVRVLNPFKLPKA